MGFPNPAMRMPMPFPYVPPGMPNPGLPQVMPGINPHMAAMAAMTARLPRPPQ
jgi:hypothetical protein